jgi:hypothetical protein
LTSWVGQLHTPVIPSRDEVFEDETGTLYTRVVGGRLFAETVLYGPFNLSTYKHWLSVLSGFELELKKLGINQYFSVVDSHEKYRWCSFLGFKPLGESIGDTIEFLVKEL